MTKRRSAEARSDFGYHGNYPEAESPTLLAAIASASASARANVNSTLPDESKIPLKVRDRIYSDPYLHEVIDAWDSPTVDAVAAGMRFETLKLVK